MTTLLLLLGTSSVSAFRRRFGIFSAAVTAANNRNDSLHHHSESSSEGGTWLDGLDCPEEDYEHDQQYHEEEEEDEEDTELLDALRLHPLLQIPTHLALTGVLHATEMPVRTFLDTGAMRTVMSWDMARRMGVLQHLDRRYSGEATGIGSCRVLGRLPAGLFAMHLHGSDVTVQSPAITILESTGLPGVELLLGLDFLREYQAVLDLRLEEIRIMVEGTEHSVPFIRPRGGNRNRPVKEREEEYEWDDEKDTHFHYDKSRSYDDERDSDQNSEEDEGEDWPDMSGV
eukprot:scaffold38210_cov191-Amphora_coffeaeformis.AAC.8